MWPTSDLLMDLRSLRRDSGSSIGDLYQLSFCSVQLFGDDLDECRQQAFMAQASD